MEGPDIPGPKIWTDLNRKSEAKIIGHLKKLEERSLWMKDYLAQAKVKMGKVRPEPEFVPKTPSSTTSRPAGRRGRSSTTHEDGNTQPVSVKKSKKKKSSRKSGSKVTTPSPLASRLAKTDQEQSTRDGLDVEATQPEAHGPNEADGGVNSRPSGPAEDHSLPDCGVGSTKESNGVADQSLTNANADDVVCEEDSCLSDLPAEETTDNVAKATMSAVQDLKLSTNHVDEDDDKASEVNQYEVIADCQESDLDGSIDNIVDQSCEVDVGAAVDATFNVTEVVDATFDTSSLPSEIRHKSLEKAHTQVSEFANDTFDIVSIADEASAEPEAVVSKIHEDVYNPVQSASYQEQLAEAVPANLTATEVAESDADVESEADVLPITAAPKAKSLRKTRTLSLQQKRALANTNESDSDAPASKTRKGERGHKSSRLVDNPLRSKNDSQSSDTAGSVRSTRSRRNLPDDVQKLPTSQQTEVSSQITRSRSRSQKDSTSTDESIPTAVSVTHAPLRRVSTRRSRSSIAASLLKVSAAKRVSIAELVAEQEVVLVKNTDTPSPILTKSRPAIKTSATPSSSSLNNSRAPAGKVVRPGRKVLASGGRGVSPATGPRSNGVGLSGGSQGGMRSRSRMQIINRSTQRTPSRSRAPSNMVAKGASFVSKPRGPNLDEIQEQKEMERQKKEEKEAEAKQRREDLMKKKADEQKNKNEARIQRVQEARKKQENQKDAKRNYEKEKAEKLEALRIREEKAKEAGMRKEIERVEKAKLEAEKRKEQERVDEENAEEEKRKDRERKLEATRNKDIEEERKRIAEERKLDEQKRVLAEKQRDAEVSLAKQTMVKSVQSKDLNSTYSKPGDITVNNTFEVSQGVSSYDMTPARHELPPEPSQDEDNYGLDDLRSDEDTDDEDCPRKEVPKWAEGTQLRTALLKQCYMGPDVDMIFANVEMPDLSTMFAHQRKRFFKRTSSAVWDTPPESFKHAARRK